MTSTPPQILLLNPKVPDYAYPHLPLGLAEIKGFLNARGIPSCVLDTWALDSRDGDVREFLQRNSAPAVGITITSFTLESVKNLAQIVKTALPEATLIAGGPHPSYDPRNFLTFNPDFDVVVFGEGEETLVEFLTARIDPSTWSGIPGLAFRDSSGSIIVNPPRTTRLNLDDLPLPDFAAFPCDKYKAHAPYGRRAPFFNLISSRGCPHQCVFCSNCVFGQRVKLKSAERIFREVEWLHKELGAREVHFYDDVFTVNRQRILTFCELLSRARLPVIWSCTTRVDMVDPEMLRAMKSAGCWLVTFGVESGSDKILAQAEKRYTTAQVLKAFAMARKARLRIHTFFMVGLPGDTRETIEETIRFAKTSRPDSSHWAVMIALPGSRVYEEVKDSRKEHVPIRYEAGLPSSVLENYRAEAIHRVLFSPSYIVRVLFSIRTFPQLRNVVSTALRLLRKRAARGKRSDDANHC